MKSALFNKGAVQIHAAVFLFGFAGLFGKFLGCSPLYIVLARTFFAAVTLFAYAGFISKTALSGYGPKTLVLFILQGILLAVHWVTFFLSIQISSVAVGLVTYSTFPLFVTFLEPFFFKERLRSRDILTAGAVFAGILLVIPEFNFSNTVTQGGCFGILSGTTFAILTLVNRRNAQVSSAVAVAFYQNLFAAACLVLPVLILPIDPPQWSDLPHLLFLGIVCTAFAHTLFIQALVFIRAQTAAVISGLEPVYGIVLAFVLLHEVPGIRTLFGGILIIGTTLFAGIRGNQK